MLIRPIPETHKSIKNRQIGLFAKTAADLLWSGLFDRKLVLSQQKVYFEIMASRFEGMVPTS